ncbi:MAG: Gfo/Idh/MocA family oxidoreductase [Planctomycetales bacterium]|nr:Gfo/Idh/MocA family oxidoreductase [Planctomycetales bacterium]MCA9228513.1 Gfo/Idh/MocA family oxidoreductase [Planctomycetales bacterium]
MQRPTPLRWGILGTARIAEKVAAAIRAAGDELRLVASRDGHRAAAWAAEHRVARSCESYAAAIEADDVDAIYIPLPPSMHAEWTIRAAECGKHVLCEKPLACSMTEAEAMAAACREHGVQLLDGVMWLHHPRAADMRRELEAGTLGDLRRVTVAFTFCRDFPVDDLRMQRALGGGSLLDLGWYCVGVALWAFGELPHRVQATARYRQDVDINFAATMWFGENRIATFDCGFDTVMRRWFEIAGTNASLVCDDFARPWQPDKARFWLHNAEGKMAERVSRPMVQEVAMIERFGEAVRSGQLRLDWPARSLATQRVCEALDLAARGGKAVEL